VLRREVYKHCRLSMPNLSFIKTYLKGLKHNYLCSLVLCASMIRYTCYTRSHVFLKYKYRCFVWKVHFGMCLHHCTVSIYKLFRLINLQLIVVFNISIGHIRLLKEQCRWNRPIEYHVSMLLNNMFCFSKAKDW